jgi:hypothetical protein
MEDRAGRLREFSLQPTPRSAEGPRRGLTAANVWARQMPEAVSEMAAPAWIEHQRAPGSQKEPTKSADGSKVKG